MSDKLRSVLGHLRGSDLDPDQQRLALAAYCHRFTKEHVPQWANEPRPDGTRYMPQFATDEEWLANTRFPVTKAGNLRRSRDTSCYSVPTWPDGKDGLPA